MLALGPTTEIEGSWPAEMGSNDSSTWINSWDRQKTSPMRVILSWQSWYAERLLAIWACWAGDDKVSIEESETVVN